MKLSQYPLIVDDEDMQTLAKKVVVMHSRSSTYSSVNDARLKICLEVDDVRSYSTYLEEAL